MKLTFAKDSIGIYLFVGILIVSLILTACAPEVATSIPSLTEAATDTSSTHEPSVSTATALPVLSLPVKDELIFKVVAQLGGTFNALAIDGNIIYLGIGPRLITVDIADPAAPRLLWRSDVLPGVIVAIALQAGLAYVTAGLEIEIYDISDPSHLLRISTVSRLAESLYGLGEIFPADDIFYAIGSGSLDYSSKSLMAFDVSDPIQPTLIRTRELSINAGVMVSREVLYIADEGKLQLFDTANLDQTFSEIELPSTESYSIAIVSNVAYVLAHNQLSPSDSLVVLDVSDPGQPQEIATLKFDIEHTIRDVAATDQALFLLGYSWPHTKCPTFLYIIDVTNPASPGDPTEFNPQSCLNRFALMDDTLAATSDRGLQLFSISDPSNIVLVGELAPPDGFLSVETVALNQGLAYLLTTPGASSLTTWARLLVLDVANPTPRPPNGDELDLGSDVEPSMFEGLDVRGDRLFFRIWPRVVDISEPASPRLITDDLEGVVYWPTPALVEDVLFTGLLTETPGGPMMRGGLGIVDMSDPANPVLADTVPMEDFMVTGMSVADRHLIVFSHKFDNPQEGSRLQIYDVSDPFKPIEVGGLHLPIEEPIITTVGDTVYLATRYGDHPTLYAVDISNPAQPIEVGRFELPNNARKMVVVGEIIYMDGIWALNVSDRSHPYLAGHLPIPIGDFNAAGDLLYLAAGDGGLYILQVEK